MPRRGVLSFPARFDVTSVRPPRLSPPLPAGAIPPRSPCAAPAAQASGQASDLQGLWTPLCVLRDRARPRECHAGSRDPGLTGRRAPARQPRGSVSGMQSTKGRAAPDGVLRALPDGWCELHAVREGGASDAQARGAASGQSLLRAGGLNCRGEMGDVWGAAGAAAPFCSRALLPLPVTRYQPPATCLEG